MGDLVVGKQSGTPGVNSFGLKQLAWNAQDGNLYAKKLEGGIEKVIRIGTEMDPSTSDLHLRAHAIDSPADHPAVPEANRGKLIYTDPATGLITFLSPSTFATQQWVQQQGYLTSQFWTRDAVSGYLYPSTLTDKVGIGTNAPVKNIDIRGAQAAIALSSSGIDNESTVAMSNNGSRYLLCSVNGNSRTGTEIPGVNKAALAHVTSWASNMLIHAVSGDLIFANSGVESFRIKANNTWAFKGGTTKLEYTPGNIPMFNSRLIVGDYAGTDYAPTSMLSVTSGYSYTSTNNIGIDVFGNRSYPSGSTYGIRVRGSSVISTSQTLVGFISSLEIKPSFPGGSIYDYYSASYFAPNANAGSYTGFFVGSTINQTGTASGKTVGLLIEPNIVNAVNWRSIEWNNSSGFGLYGGGTAKNYLNGRLGLKTDTPTRDLDINGTFRVRTLADGSGSAYTKVLVADANGNVDAVDKTSIAGSIEIPALVLEVIDGKLYAKWEGYNTAFLNHTPKIRIFRYSKANKFKTKLALKEYYDRPTRSRRWRLLTKFMNNPTRKKEWDCPTTRNTRVEIDLNINDWVQDIYDGLDFIGVKLPRKNKGALHLWLTEIDRTNKHISHSFGLGIVLTNPAGATVRPYKVWDKITPFRMGALWYEDSGIDHIRKFIKIMK